MGRHYQYCLGLETHPPLTGKEIERGNKKRELEDLRKQYIQAKYCDVVEMNDCDWWKLTRKIFENYQIWKSF